MLDALDVILVAFFTAIMVVAGYCDVRDMRIGNGIVVALAAGWPAFVLAAGLDLHAAAAALAAGFGVLAAGFLAFRQGWVGGGDVKLAAATALWLGPAATLVYLVYVALIGGAIALVVLAFRNAGTGRPRPGRRWLRRLLAPSMPVPYGPALAAGALIAFAEYRVEAIA